jgi:colanic acid/amylovoran biosynthesis protein
MFPIDCNGVPPGQSGMSVAQPLVAALPPEATRGNSRRLTVGLLWHSLDSGNLGVVALSIAQMRLVQEAAAAAGTSVQFVVIGGTNDDVNSPVPDVVQVCRVGRNRVLGLDGSLRRAFDACDLVLDIGEGDSFADIYGWKRLTFHLATKFMATRGGRPFVFSPQTLGPFKGRLSGWWADRVLSRAALVCTRDAISSAFYRARGLQPALLEATDVAFALPYTPRARDAVRPQVGLNISGLLWSGGYTGGNQFGLRMDYRQLVLDLVDWFQGPGGAEVWLVPHVVTPQREVEDDWRASQQVSVLRPGVRLAGPFADPSAAKSFISGLDFFAGARMHACIAAFSSGVPCVPMAYSRKFTGLFNTLGYTRVADCTSETAQQVCDVVQRGFREREAIREEVAHGCRAARDRLDRYRQALTELIHSTEPSRV